MGRLADPSAALRQEKALPRSKNASVSQPGTLSGPHQHALSARLQASTFASLGATFPL